MMINHIMHTSKIFIDLCFIKQELKTKYGSVKVVDNVLVVNNVLQCFSCLSINGKQSEKLEEGIIEFENYFKQIPVPNFSNKYQ